MIWEPFRVAFGSYVFEHIATATLPDIVMTHRGGTVWTPVHSAQLPERIVYQRVIQNRIGWWRREDEWVDYAGLPVHCPKDNKC